VVYAANGTINTSDERLKRDIKDTSLGIEFIDRLRPVEYFFREGPFATTKKYGFVAQDLQKLGFEGVDATNPSALGLNYTELLAPTIKGLQEVHGEVHRLEALVGMLVEKIRALEVVAGKRAE
jgi:hypothetical protein